MSVGETYLTVQGRVGGDIKFKEVAGRVALASFRLGTTPRQFDKAKGGWVDRPTTWFTVECWRTLAENVNESLERGQPVVVTGRLKTTEWLENGESRSRTVLDATAIGHDLARGKATFTRNTPQQQAAEFASLDEEMRDLSSQAEHQPHAVPTPTSHPAAPDPNRPPQPSLPSPGASTPTPATALPTSEPTQPSSESRTGSPMDLGPGASVGPAESPPPRTRRAA